MLPDIPTPTSFALTKAFYPEVQEIIREVGALLGKDIDTRSILADENPLHDVPGKWFKGPF